MIGLDVDRVRSHFDFAGTGRVVTNNAASTQPPRELLDLYRSLTLGYENVHRGQSAAARRTTELFENAYDTVAAWIGAPSRRCVVVCRNTTEAINTVMYSLLTDFRDGDNIVTTMLEHNSDYVPWYALTHEILPRFGRRVQCRLARFDPGGRLDLDHLASLVDERTKLICCTGASNFTGSRPDLAAVRCIADPPWKFSAGTPNILGVIVSAQALRLLVDLVSGRPDFFGRSDPIPYGVVQRTMTQVAEHTAALTERARSALAALDGVTVYGPPARAPLVAFTRAGTDPFTLVKSLGQQGIEARAGCHCATLAHHALGLDPPASCRLSFALYNTEEDVDRAVAAVAAG